MYAHQASDMPRQALPMSPWLPSLQRLANAATALTSMAAGESSDLQVALSRLSTADWTRVALGGANRYNPDWPGGTDWGRRSSCGGSGCRDDGGGGTTPRRNGMRSSLKATHWLWDQERVERGSCVEGGGLKGGSDRSGRGTLLDRKGSSGTPHGEMGVGGGDGR